MSAAFPAVGGGILTAGGSQLTLHLPAERGGQWITRVIAEVPAREGVRFNDAGVDPAGRVWVGSMHVDESEPLGELYRLDAGGVLTTVVKGVTVSNGLGWSPDGARMYYADSPLRRIDVFDYDPATGEAFARRVFADLSAFDGVPDGLTVDADGCVWVAMWGGGVLRRFTPDGSPGRRAPGPGLPAHQLRVRRPGTGRPLRDDAGIGKPVILVGHSYAGMVITQAAADNDAVIGLVYVCAFAPEHDENAFELSMRFPGSTLGDALIAYPVSSGGNEFAIRQDLYHHQFAADLSPAETAPMAVTQRPATEIALSEGLSTPTPAWKTIPSWFVIGAQDRNIPAALQRFEAQRAGARGIREVAGGSHAVAVSDPGAVAETILEAVEHAALEGVGRRLGPAGRRTAAERHPKIQRRKAFP